MTQEIGKYEGTWRNIEIHQVTWIQSAAHWRYIVSLSFCVAWYWLPKTWSATTALVQTFISVDLIVQQLWSHIWCQCFYHWLHILCSQSMKLLSGTSQNRIIPSKHGGPLIEAARGWHWYQYAVETGKNGKWHEGICSLNWSQYPSSAIIVCAPLLETCIHVNIGKLRINHSYFDGLYQWFGSWFIIVLPISKKFQPSLDVNNLIVSIKVSSCVVVHYMLP